MRTCVYPLIPQLFTRSGISAARSPLRSLRSLQINCHLRFSHVESTSQRSSADEGRHRMCTIPNILCVARIAATPAIGYLIVEEHFSTAFTLFIVAGLTDLADGYIARNFQGQKSLLGSVLDPVADKLLISVMFVAMSSAGLIPVSLTILVLLRDALLILGGTFKRYRTLDPPLSLARFFNPDVSPMQIVPTRVSKVNTVLQLAVVACSLANPVFEFGAAYQDVSQLLNWTTAITTIYSGLQYASGSAFKKV